MKKLKLSWIFFCLSLAIALNVFAHPNTKSQEATKGFFLDPGQTIWAHVHGSEELMQAQWLMLCIKKRIPHIDPFFSTTTISSIENFVNFGNTFDVGPIKVISHDNLESMAGFFNLIQPKAILVMEHELLPCMMIIAHLKEIPIYLLNGSVSHKTERMIVTAPYLYLPLINSFNIIFAKSKEDQIKFQNMGITTPQIIPVNNLTCYRIIEKKNYYLQHLNKEDKKLFKNFPYPILLVSLINQESCQKYLELFLKLKEEFPTLKLILAPNSFLSKKLKIIKKLEKLAFDSYVWDIHNQELNNKPNLLSSLKTIFDKFDILLTPIHGKLFFLLALASIFITSSPQKSILYQNIIEAAAWKTPVIITSKVALSTPSIKDLNKFTSVTFAGQPDQIYQATKLLLKNKAYRTQITQQAFNLTKKLSEDAQKELEPLFKDLTIKMSVSRKNYLH